MRFLWPGDRLELGGFQRWMWCGHHSFHSGDYEAACVHSPDLVVPPCRMLCHIEAALQRWVPHGGGLLGAVQLISLVS